jgi:hypothetical protein
MQYDIIALQCQGTNVALGGTPAGHEFLSRFRDKPEWNFMDFIQSIALSGLNIGVLDPDGQTLNFTSHPLH